METTKVTFDRKDLHSSVNFDMGNKFYLGYENNPARQVSILFPDLTWLKKTFGDNLERMNDGRKNEINNLELCVKHNIPMYELENLKYLTPEGKFMRKSLKGVEKLVEYHPYELGATSTQRFKDNIAQGLLILCELV